MSTEDRKHSRGQVSAIRAACKEAVYRVLGALHEEAAPELRRSGVTLRALLDRVLNRSSLLPRRDRSDWTQADVMRALDDLAREGRVCLDVSGGPMVIQQSPSHGLGEGRLGRGRACSQVGVRSN